MSRVITFSRTFPAYHPKAGQPTHFVEKFWKSISECNIEDPLVWFNSGMSFAQIFEGNPQIIDGNFYSHAIAKHHTIRSGHRFKAGDWFTPKVWGDDINPKSGRKGPYQSKQIRIAPDIQVKKTWDFRISKYLDANKTPTVFIDFGHYSLHESTHATHSAMFTLAKNDGLDLDDLLLWFKYPKPFDGQIICWNQQINY